MDGFDLGDIIGSLFGGAAETGGAGEVAGGLLGGMFGGELGGRSRGNDAGQPVSFERYLCGGPKYLNINDR